MSEVITPPVIMYDASGDPVYTFTSAHTLADVARWIIKEGAREDMLYLLQTLKGESHE